MEQLMRVLFVVLGFSLGLTMDVVSSLDLSEEKLSWFYTVIVPFVFFAGYMIIIVSTLGSVFTIHLNLGIPIVAAIVGYLVKLSQVN